MVYKTAQDENNVRCNKMNVMYQDEKEQQDENEETRHNKIKMTLKCNELRKAKGRLDRREKLRLC